MSSEDTWKATNYGGTVNSLPGKQVYFQGSGVVLNPNGDIIAEKHITVYQNKRLGYCTAKESYDVLVIHNDPFQMVKQTIGYQWDINRKY